MSPEKTRKLLTLLGCKVPKSQLRAGWFLSDCPLGPWKHGGGKSSAGVFGVKKEQGDPRGNCFSCGWHGSMGDLVLEMRQMNKVNPRITVKWADALTLIEEAEADMELALDSPDIEECLFGEKPGLHAFPEWWLKSFAPVEGIKWAEDYLAARDVTPDMALRLDMRADTKQMRVCVPLRDFEGVLRGFHGRAISDDVDPRYRMYTHARKNNPIVWLGESWVDLSRPIVVVEGPFDLASVRRVYDNTVSPLFCNPSFEKLRRMSDCLEWITLFDRGTGGDAGRAKVSQCLHRDHVVHHLQPPKGRKDPGVMQAPEIAEILSPLVQLIAQTAC